MSPLPSPPMSSPPNPPVPVCQHYVYYHYCNYHCHYPKTKKNIVIAHRQGNTKGENDAHMNIAHDAETREAGTIVPQDTRI